jgi:hypothetical protein
MTQEFEMMAELFDCGRRIGHKRLLKYADGPGLKGCVRGVAGFWFILADFEFGFCEVLLALLLVLCRFRHDRVSVVNANPSRSIQGPDSEGVNILCSDEGSKRTVYNVVGMVLLGVIYQEFLKRRLELRSNIRHNLCGADLLLRDRMLGSKQFRTLFSQLHQSLAGVCIL